MRAIRRVYKPDILVLRKQSVQIKTKKYFLNLCKYIALLTFHSNQ